MKASRFPSLPPHCSIVLEVQVSIGALSDESNAFIVFCNTSSVNITVNLSTVYKILDLLKEKKLVNEIEVEGESRFDAHTEHINLVCMKCGKIDEVDEESLKEIQGCKKIKISNFEKQF
jgi:Fe2+ or Zn2+ uptake regulation protein